MKETKTLEFKESITNSFLKTISAFSNYTGGKIIFGIDDNGNVKGIPHLKETCLDIENKINDNITPQPNYTIDVDESNNTIILDIQVGEEKPYLYKSKAYKRNDTATIEVDHLEFSRLILEGKQLNFEQLPSRNQDLSFDTLKDKLIQKTDIDDFSKDILKTLNLYSNKAGYNNAANILSDNNSFPGIDIVVFGETINIIRKRITLDNKSILQSFDEAVDVFKDNYNYELIEGIERIKKSKIPESSFREALANALIHRTWDSSSHIAVSMFDDKVEIVSPGGLPSDLSKEEYLNGRISVLRNPIISNVFYRLGMVEIFGTGILRIKQDYVSSIMKPDFSIMENTIKITLPVMETKLNISEDEQSVYSLLSKVTPKSISEIHSESSFGKSKVLEILNKLVEKKIITKVGQGRGTKYLK